MTVSHDGGDSIWARLSASGWMPFPMYDYDFHPSLSGNPQRPWNVDKIEIWRPEWEKPTVTAYRDMNPEMNVAGLYWRPAREE